MRTSWLFVVAMVGCAELPADDFGIEGPVTATQPGGKEDNAGRSGPLVASNTTATQVWLATNKWEDRDTVSARKAGLAWGESSGLSWDEKFSTWIDSLHIIPGTGYDTYELVTPWGKTMPAPVLECAESQMFLRATFAAWYNLPFMLETAGPEGRIFFGHFGIRTSTAKYQNTPNFAQAYRDYSAYTAAQLAAGWPSDAVLRTRAALGGDDAQAPINEVHIGAYLDEIHLNKRAGHFIVYLLNFLGSANLADTANTYNLKPASMHAGDLLLHRWQKNGIGDAKLVKTVSHDDTGRYTARLMSGSMPRRQSKIYTASASTSYFEEDDTGGPGTNPDGDSYFKLGGGLKRWRVTKNVGGRWTNTWMTSDEDDWIDSTNEAAVTARPAQLGDLLEEVTPARKKTALLAQIDDAREHLLQYPSSCSARERREQAFAGLYALASQLGTTQPELDHEYRRLEDYVFAPLVYTQSKTCCWDSSTAAMAAIIMDYAVKEQANQCVAPTVFKSETGGYARWAAHAATLGRAADWKAWSEDETCAARAVAQDAVAATTAGAFCSIDPPAGPTCAVDGFEPNESPGTAHAVLPGTIYGQMCRGDQDWFSVGVAAGRTLIVHANFSHAAGDLDLVVLAPNGVEAGRSESTTDVETVTIASTVAGNYKIHLYGYAGATNAYSLTIQ